jgi:hypothetical protein
VRKCAKVGKMVGSDVEPSTPTSEPEVGNGGVTKSRRCDVGADPSLTHTLHGVEPFCGYFTMLPLPKSEVCSNHRRTPHSP